jgi:hypothetical protein
MTRMNSSLMANRTPVGSKGPHRLTWCAALVVVGAGAAWSVGGPLNPPGGPISSTYKTLTDVEPRILIQSLSGNATSVHRITQAGSYYLGGSITAGAGFSGIEVAASGVTIDLNGFRIVGLAGSGNGIVAGAAIVNLTVRNGSILGMGGDGIDAVANSRTRVESVSVNNCSGAGVLAGSGSVLTSVVTEANGLGGINAGSAAALENCIANNNGGVGIQADASSVVRGSTAINNGGNGIQVGLGSLVVDCSSKDQVPAGANGILAGQGSQVMRCTVRNNTAAGIRLEDGASALDCNASFNRVGVLVMTNGSVVERNAISDSAVAGVQLNGADTRVVGNNLNSNAIGVSTVGNGGNIIMQNTLSGNAASFAFGANDRFGPVIAVAAGAIPAATTPYANLVY